MDTPQEKSSICYQVAEEIAPQDRETVRQGLREYNLPRWEDTHAAELNVLARDPQGQIQGGILAETHGKWLEIEFLWVAEGCRGQKIGSRLLQYAEEEARTRGCQYAFLNTLDFQAPEFYPRFGYREVFALEEFPRTGRKTFFIKNL